MQTKIVQDILQRRNAEIWQSHAILYTAEMLLGVEKQDRQLVDAHFRFELLSSIHSLIQLQLSY